MPADAQSCPFCGNSRKKSPEEERTPDGLAVEETVAALRDAEADDWRPNRYERRARRTRAQSRSRQPGRQTLQLLAGWLAALIVIAGGIFWYIWSEDAAAAQPQSAPLTATAAAE